MPCRKPASMDELLREFITETSESLDTVDNQLVTFEREPNNAAILAGIFRLVHTIKGTCGFIGLPRLEALTHAAETLMGRFRDGAEATSEAVTLILTTIDRIKTILDALETTHHEPPGDDAELIASLQAMARDARVALDKASPDAAPAVAPQPEVKSEEKADAGIATRAEAKTEDAKPSESKLAAQSIRVDVDTLEHLMTMVSELVLTRNQLIDLLRRQKDSDFTAPLQRLSSVTAELQDGIMKTRMQPIGHAWQKLPRIIRDLAAELGKDISLDMQGADTELDRQVLELIKDPLTHMIRNSADHGLETPAERAAAGKPEQGTIRLSAYHEGGYVIVTIADDGRGLNTAAIKAKALAAKLTTEAELAKLSEAQIHRFIYAAGFSTASKVTSVSGRGVGMDVVRSHIDRVGGTVDVKSVEGEGSCFTIRIPLTLAIISALIVESGGQRFALPRLAVVEILRAHDSADCRVDRIGETAVLRLRGHLLPLVHLDRLLQTETSDEGHHVVVMQVGSRRFGLMVDGALDVQEIVAKPLATRLRHINLLAGSTILGDGSVIMIVDPNGVARSLGVEALAELQPAEDAVEIAADKTSLLVFRAGGREPKAVPLSLVTRIEEIDVARVEISDGRRMIQYRGALMPLIEIGGARLRDGGRQPVLVVTDDGRTMGLVVDEIVDIAEETMAIDLSSRTEGVIGSAVIRGQATEVVDVGHFLPIALDGAFGLRPASATSPAVLLVDDSAFFRDMLAPVLRAAGYRVTSAAGAPEAFELLRAGQRYEAVLADTEMPGIDGFAFARALRADAGLRGMPLIALSATLSPAEIERVREAGFQDQVAKFDRIGLIAALRGQTTAFSRAA